LRWWLLLWYAAVVVVVAEVVVAVVVVVVTAPRVSEAISGDHCLPPCLAYLKAGRVQRAI
jgi:hypothetical protein